VVDIYFKNKTMIKFGVIKSKIEKILVESYSDKTFKYELKNFKNNVLDNKNISQIYYLYDEIKSKKGLNESYASEYINECITIYENTINKIKTSDINKLKKWVNGVKSSNEYEHIDNLFSNDVLTIESKIKSKKIIRESLTKSLPIQKEFLKLPLSTMVSIANKTIQNYVESLNESEKKELADFLSMDDKPLEEDFNKIKKEVISKLGNLKEGSDSESLHRINETVDKVSSEKYDKFNYFKLKKLNENL
jgi:hypothetical protein